MRKFATRQRRSVSVFRDPQVNLYVDDVEEAVAFYHNLFGFVETFRTPKIGEPIHVELRLGGLILGLASIESLRAIHDVNLTPGTARSEIVLWTDNVDKALEELKEEGVKTLREPHDFNETLRAGWIADLDGNPIQIVQKK